MILGIVLWILVMLFQPNQTPYFLHETGGGIFELIIYLLSAMTLVEIIAHFGFFDFIYEEIFHRNLSDKQLFFFIVILAFLFSTFINNLTTTIIFITIARQFFKKNSLVKVASAIVIASNAGGVFSPIGDVTTTMLWFAGKFSATTIVTQAVLPSIVAFMVSILFISNGITSEIDNNREPAHAIAVREWIVIALSFLSFFLPLIMTAFHLPAYMGLLLGIGIVWMFIDVIKLRRQKSSLDISIERLFQRADIASLNFFIGILLTVSALQYLGILDDISRFLFTASPNHARIISGALALGGLSAIFDNIPLTAAAIAIVKTTDHSLWVLVAYTVGFGGSLFSIGSGSGIIAMAIVRELTFVKYLKNATIPVLIAFSLGAIVWYLQYLFL